MRRPFPLVLLFLLFLLALTKPAFAVDDGCGGKLDCVSVCSTAPRCAMSDRSEPPVELLGLGVGLAYIFLAGRARLRRNQ
jgi:hypothetical protein